jgi:hypothetical protein
MEDRGVGINFDWPIYLLQNIRMASYNSNQLYGAGAPIEALTSGNTYTFAVTSSASGSTYFTLETVRNPIGYYDSSSPATATGNIENLTNITGLVASPYIFSVVTNQGGGSFTFTPATNVAASGSFLRGTGGISLNIASSASPFVNPTLTVGSAVTTIAQSPFSGGGNSYSFISSTNSFIDTPASSDWAVGTEDFTIEWFQYQTTTAGFQRVFTVDDFPSIDIGVSVEEATFYYWANDTFRYNSAGATTPNVWIHWAVVRQSGVTKVYKNGTQLGSQITDTNNINNTIDQLTIGNENTPSTIAAFVGYITNFRWVKGLAVYTGNFTTPTSVLTATAGANPYGGSNTQAISSGLTKLLLIP